MINVTKQKIILISFVLGIFLLSIAFTYNYTDFSSNMSVGSGHAFTAKSLALSGNFNVDEYWGNSGADVIHLQNGYYLPYAPLNPIIRAVSYFPIYKFFYKLTRFVSMDNSTFTGYESVGLNIASSASLALVYLGLFLYINKKIKAPLKLSTLLPITVILGTILFTYSVSYFNHIFSAFLSFYAFLFLISKYKYKYLIAGLLVGLSFLNEFPSILFSIGVGLAEITLVVSKSKKISSSIRDLSIFAVPILTSIVLILLYNRLVFGDYFLFGEQIFKEQRILKGDRYFSFSQNIFFGLYGMYISPLKGLFSYSPFLIVSFLGAKKFYSRNKYAFVVASVFILVISLLYSSWNDCFGATAFGNRYIVMLIPFWGICMIYGYKKIEKFTFAVVFFWILAIYSMLLILLNTFIGIADYKMGKCENINNYSPAERVWNNYLGKKPKTSPTLFKILGGNKYNQ